MPDTMSKVRLARLFPILGFVALGACHVDPNTQNPIELINSHTFDHGNWQQIPRPLDNQVEPITVVHSVNFEPGTTEVSEAEIGRLQAFLQKSDVHQGARIEIDGPRGRGGYLDPVSAARISDIQAELSDMGLRSDIPTRPITSLVKPEGAITVSVTQAMVILPDCSTEQPRPADRPSYTHSCSNRATLGMMIADPVDLERGRTPGPADGEVAARSVQRYRAGQVIPPRSSGL